MHSHIGKLELLMVVPMYNGPFVYALVEIFLYTLK